MARDWATRRGRKNPALSQLHQRRLKVYDFLGTGICAPSIPSVYTCGRLVTNSPTSQAGMLIHTIDVPPLGKMFEEHIYTIL